MTENVVYKMFAILFRPECVNVYEQVLYLCTYPELKPDLSVLTLLMLETEYSGLFGQNHCCLCPGSLSRQGIGRYGIDSLG